MRTEILHHRAYIHGDLVEVRRNAPFQAPSKDPEEQFRWTEFLIFGLLRRFSNPHTRTPQMDRTNLLLACSDLVSDLYVPGTPWRSLDLWLLRHCLRISVSVSRRHGHLRVRYVRRPTRSIRYRRGPTRRSQKSLVFPTPKSGAAVSIKIALGSGLA